MFVVKKAVRTQRRIKISLDGLSGAGKTTTALLLAHDMVRQGIGKRILVIDSENGSASMYAGMQLHGLVFDFEVVEMPPEKRNPAGYAEAYEWAVSQGFDTIIFDSLSHAWHGALEQVDQMARGKDKMLAWAAMSPIQRQMIQTLTDTRAHTIVTLRVKSDYQQTEGSNGKMRMQKIGTKADQKDNLEYEFDMVLRFETGNECFVEKVRGCTEMNGKSTVKPGPSFWKPFFDWWKSAGAAQPVNNSGASIDAQPDAKPIIDIGNFINQMKECQTKEELKAVQSAIGMAAKMGQVPQNELPKLRTAGFAQSLKLADSLEERSDVAEQIAQALNDGKINEKQKEWLDKEQEKYVAM